MPAAKDTSAGLDALGTLARSAQYRQVIRYLVDNPNSFKGQIHDATGIPTSSLGRHLSDLETRGIVTGDIEVGQKRRGYAVRYIVDVDYVDTLLTTLRTELLG
ncbi:helix-turn-helix transcriptional regulator [Agreia pratensis]|uniref:helix-turn-helix domain-containing protein n=1 Tax=Agreia pratensis TaxID=150121 RepID=UPI00188D196B|nr:helix-turn-helix domain-containing protein [Agreia pratensis]MBF4636227.1 helix-turn-helix transcriptional regulator [Agreia pratensis]